MNRKDKEKKRIKRIKDFQEDVHKRNIQMQQIRDARRGVAPIPLEMTKEPPKLAEKKKSEIISEIEKSLPYGAFGSVLDTSIMIELFPLLFKRNKTLTTIK